jgi:hypothetical protein
MLDEWYYCEEVYFVSSRVYYSYLKINLINRI